MGKYFYYLTYQDKIENLEDYIFKKFCLPVFTQETIYHVRTEMRQSLGIHDPSSRH